LSTISDRFIGNKVDLVLAIATPAAQAIAGKTTEIPILGHCYYRFVEARLVDSNEKPGKNVTGTSDMNPIKEQIDFW
jgi:putative ABC transport system substrate-binding protein